MSEAAASPLLLATDAADTLAATGIPFREAHEIVGRQGAVSTASVEEVLSKKNVFGGTSPDRVLAAAKAALAALDESQSLKVSKSQRGDNAGGGL
jgi:argininosuccinate lyase